MFGLFKKKSSKMVLELLVPPAYQCEVISKQPDEAAIKKAIQSQKWDDITFVVLRIDAENALEVSGSHADGLSASYFENGEQSVSNGAPESLDFCIKLLNSYLKKDDEWRNMIPWDGN